MQYVFIVTSANFIHKNTADGLQTAKERGKRVGTPKGTKLVTKKSKKAKAIILEHSKTFGGTLSDTECMKLADVTMKTYYIYKKELKAEYGTNINNTIQTTWRYILQVNEK